MSPLTLRFFFFAGCAVVWVVAWICFRALGRKLAARPDFADVPWTVADLFLFALTFFAFEMTAIVVLVPEESRGEGDPWVMAAGFLSQAVGAGVVLVLLLTMRRVRLSHLGFARENLGRRVAYGIAGYLVFVPLVILANQASALLLESLGHQVEPQEVVRVFLEKVRPADGRPGDPWLIVFFVLSTVVVVPVCEEFLFRGLLLGGLRRWLPPVPAILLSSYMFALAHTLSTLFPIFALALIMGIVYDRTRSLPAVIAIHATHNGVMVLGMFLQ